MKMTKSQIMILFVVTIAIAMVYIDMTILGVALPSIQKVFNATRSETQFIVTIYLLVTAVLTFSVGRLSDMLGHKKIFIMGTGIFCLASLACGLSVNISMLVMARALQAFGSAFILIGGMSLLAQTFSDEDRGKANGIAMSVGTLMMTIAPFLGGIILKFLSWHWIFFVNVILGLIISPALIAIYKQSKVAVTHKKRDKFDWFGFASIGFFTVAITLTFNHLSQWGWFGAKTIGGFIMALIALLIFLKIERKHQNPIIQLKLFKIANYIPGCMIMALTQAMNFFAIFFAVFIQNALGYSPFVAGILLLPSGILLAVFSSAGGYFADKFGARVPMISGLSIISVGFLVTTLSIQSMSYFSLLPAMIGYGIGACFLSTPLRTALLRQTPKAYFGMTTSILSGTRQIGGVIGFSVIGYIIVHVEKVKASVLLLKKIPGMTIENAHHLLGVLSGTQQSKLALAHFSLPDQVAIKHIVLSSYVSGFFYALLLMTLLTVISLFIATVSIKK